MGRKTHHQDQILVKVVVQKCSWVRIPYLAVYQVKAKEHYLCKMLPAYIIHNSNQTERKEIVDNLIQTTGAKVVEAVWNTQDPVWGCRESHKKVAVLAKEEHPDSAYLVFEDDCEIVDPHFLELIVENPDVDLLYFGVNGFCVHKLPYRLQHSWGTHAMYMTPKVRDLFLNKEAEYLQLRFPLGNHPLDQLFCVMEDKENLKVWKPNEKTMKKWVRQKPGLKSAISGSIRT
jgi:hypothetical protein